MKSTQKSVNQKKPANNGKRNSPLAQAPRAAKPPAPIVPRAMLEATVRGAVATETKRVQSSAAKQNARTKVHHAMSRVANRSVGPVDISAEERAIVTAFSTMHPELVRGKVPDAITSATSELRTVSNFAFVTLNNGGNYETLLSIAPFLNDQVYSATTYAAGVISVAGFADNPAYGPWTGAVGDIRLVSMSVVIECTTPALNLTGNWVIGNSRAYLAPLVGASYNTYAQVVDFAKGVFTVEDPSCRMVWMANDESDRNFVPMTSTSVSTGSNCTLILVAVTSGAAVGTFNCRIICNWEVVPVPAAQTFIPTTSTPTDPGTYTQAMAAASDSAVKNVSAVTNPDVADKSSGKTLAEISSAALGVAGDVLTGDFPGIVKDAGKLLSPVKDAIGDAVGFVADGISSLFGLSAHADLLLRNAIQVGVLGETKAMEEIKALDDRFGLKGKLYNPLKQLADLQLVLMVSKVPKRIRDIEGITATLNGQRTDCRLAEGEQGRTLALRRSV